MTSASQLTGLHDPSVGKVAAPVDGKAHHSNATIYVDHAESFALRPVFIRLIVFTAVFFDAKEVYGGGVGIGAVVFVRCIIEVIGWQLVIEATSGRISISDSMGVAPPDAQYDSRNECGAKMDARADS